MSLIPMNDRRLTIKEEKSLKEAKIFVQEEFEKKKETKLKLKKGLSETKKIFHRELQEYQKLTKLTIDKENEIEQLYIKITKLKKKERLAVKTKFSHKLYTHLLEIAENKNKENLLKKYFSLILFENNQKERTVKELIKIFKNEEEIKNLLCYSYIMYIDLRKNNISLFHELKQRIDSYHSEISKLEGQYPFDFLFDCLRNVFDIIELENLIKESNDGLNKLIEKKNSKFVEVKNIELKIKNYNRNIRTIDNYMKAVNNFFNRIKEYNKNPSNQKAILIRELIDEIDKFKMIEFDFSKMNNNFDAMSLTIGTNYTQSEESSMKSNKNGSKNGLQLVNNLANKNPNLVQVSKMKTFDSNKFCGSNNSKNIISDNKKIIKSNEKSDENNIYINDNEDNKKDFNKSLNSEKNIEKIRKTYNDNFSNKKSQNSDFYINNSKNKTNFIIDKEDKKLEIADDRLTTSNPKINNNSKNELSSFTNSIVLNSSSNVHRFNNTHQIGQKMSQLKSRESDEFIDLTVPKENTKKDYIIEDLDRNEENFFRDDSVCDEMISDNFEKENNLIRSITNDYINRISLKNNIILSREMNKNKLLLRKGDFGQLKIERAVETSSCCVSCT